MNASFKICPRLLKGMSLFATTDEERYNLAALFFRWDTEGFLEIVGTDGFVIGVWGEKVEEFQIDGPGSAVVPIHTFKRFLAEAASKKNLKMHPTVEILLTDEQVSMEATLNNEFELTLAGKLVDGEYPDWKKLIPSEETFRPISKLGVNIGKLELFRRASSLIAAGADGIVALRFTDEKGVMEVKIGGVTSEFTGYLMPATIFG
jgi:DNA polymerase III sliding clamp (beta) subunit (PCNA family)